MTRARARLVLEDGSCFEGVGCGADGVTSGEVVFNTSMTGYQEILTDPSYAGQIVTMTCPEIGNYGTTPLDAESRRPFVAGFIVRECSPAGQQLAVVGHARGLPAGARHRRARRHRHARAHAPAAVGRRAARRHRHRRCRRRGAGRPRAPDAADGRARPGRAK